MQTWTHWLVVALPLVAGCALEPGAEGLFCETCTSDATLGSGGAGAGGGDAGSGGQPPACACDDGDPCNGVETCAADGSCVSGTEPDPNDNDRCTTDSCVWDRATGKATFVHTPKNVDDGNPCTDDSCDPTIGVFHHQISGCMTP